MPALTTANLLAYVLQIAAIIAIGAGLPLILRLTSPRARLVYWRTVLVVCLVLPLIQPLTPAPAPAVETASLGSFDLGTTTTSGLDRVGVGTPSEPSPHAPWPIERTVAVVILLGIVARFVWLGMGLVTLGRLRRSAARLIPRPPAVDKACLLTGTDAEFRAASAVTRPVTFGVLRPVVVVPDAFVGFDEPQQTAVACHELVHVRRRDWLRTFGDEVIRSLLWFHPALWWLLDQIHLTTEQVVDQEVVAATGARQPYLEALVRLAARAPTLTIRPASLFIRRSHLRERVTLLLKEVSMSRTRLAVSFMTMAVALLVSGRLVVSAFPLQGRTPAPVPLVAGIVEQLPASSDYDALLKGYQNLLAAKDSKVAANLPVPAAQLAAAQPQGTQTAKPQGSLRPGEPVPQPATPREAGGGLAKIHDVRPVYPPEAAAVGTSGPVVLAISIDAAGIVTDAKVLKGDVLLADAALDAVRQWRYRPPASAPVNATVAVNVLDTEQPVAVPGGVRVGGDITAPTKLKHVSPVYPDAAKKEGVQGVVIAEAKIDPTGTVADARILRSVPLLDVAALDAIMQWRFTPTLLNGVAVPVMMTATVNFVLDSKPKTTGVQGSVGAGVGPGVGPGVAGGTGGGVVGGVVGALPGAPPPPPPPQAPVRVGGNITAPTKTKHVAPIYPPDALAAKVQGIVIVEAVIGKDGKVESAKVIRSIPELDQAALDAVQQWEFTPTLVNGVALPVVMTVTVNFKLQ